MRETIENTVREVIAGLSDEGRVVEDFKGGQTVRTILTPNSDSVATASGDVNDTTQLQFQYNNSITYWAPSVTSSSGPAELGADVGNSVVTFMKGLTVTYNALSGGMYNVLCSGKIKDGNTIYNLTGKSLGTFPQGSAGQ
ncbi:MAG: hypothetical protein AAF481_12115 [Acidobacteriota bacterium]